MGACKILQQFQKVAIECPYDLALEVTASGPQIDRRVTIRDVAVRAGVAASTVSRALSDPERVHPVTRERVVHAAQEIGYRGSSHRREPLGTMRHSVALLIPDIANPFYAGITRGTQLQLKGAGFTQVLTDTEESAAIEAQSLRQASQLTDGVVLAATRLSDVQLRAAAQATPVVLVNRHIEGFSSVSLDTGLGFRQAVEHLVSLGHRSIAYLSGPVGSWSDGIRWSAIQAAARGLNVRTFGLGPFAPTFASGAPAADALANSDATACIAFNDLLAIGAMRRLAARGIDVPRDLSVVGCDDIFGADFCNPPLTTVTGDLQRVGRTAIQILLGMLQDPGRAADRVTLPTHLTIRASSGESSR
jgi:LacI family repressor for deo operon, udp, cdd, tsx, nupC, and nupG